MIIIDKNMDGLIGNFFIVENVDVIDDDDPAIVQNWNPNIKWKMKSKSFFFLPFKNLKFSTFLLKFFHILWNSLHVFCPSTTTTTTMNLFIHTPHINTIQMMIISIMKNICKRCIVKPEEKKKNVSLIVCLFVCGRLYYIDCFFSWVIITFFYSGIVSKWMNKWWWWKGDWMVGWMWCVGWMDGMEPVDIMSAHRNKQILSKEMR